MKLFKIWETVISRQEIFEFRDSAITTAVAERKAWQNQDLNIIDRGISYGLDFRISYPVKVRFLK